MERITHQIELLYNYKMIYYKIFSNRRNVKYCEECSGYFIVQLKNNSMCGNRFDTHCQTNENKNGI